MYFSLKKTFSCVTVVALAFMLCIINSAGAYVLENVTEETLIKGVTYTRHQRLCEGGWQDIHVVRADLSEPHLAFDVLRSADGYSFLENTYASAVASGAVAAVNADFFAAKRGQSGRGSAVGVEIKDGELNTTPASDEKMHALYETPDGNIFFNEFTYDITITAPNGNTDKIRHINKYDDLNGIVLYNRSWNTLSQGATYGIIEVVVADNRVIEKRRFSEPAEIPENGFILSSDLDVHTFLDDNFNVGDEVKLDISTAPNYELIDKAVGGGGLLVVEGQPQTSFSHNIGGKNPRTAVGLDESGKIMYLVVVDGRRSLADGMTQTELGQLMAELGCYNALNLDGGGSALMAIREDGEYRVANTLSDGYKRPVTNSIGIMSTAEVGEATELEIITDSSAMFKNTTRVLELRAYDRYHQRTEIDESAAQWSVSGIDGELSEGLLRARSAGTAVVTASLSGLSAQLTLPVYDEIASLEFDEKELSMSGGESKILSLTARNSDGFGARLYARDADISVSDGCGSVTENLLTAKSGAGIITAGFAGVKAYCSLSVDGADAPSVPDNIKKADSAEARTDGGYSFSVFGNTRNPSNLFDLFMMNNTVSAMKSNSAMQAFVGSGINSALLGEISGSLVLADNYNKFTNEGGTFITIANTGGTIYGEDMSQWERLTADAEGAEGNLFVLLNKAAVSSNEVELESFKRLMEAAAKRGVFVFVILCVLYLKI